MERLALRRAGETRRLEPDCLLVWRYVLLHEYFGRNVAVEPEQFDLAAVIMSERGVKFSGFSPMRCELSFNRLRNFLSPLVFIIGT